MTGVPQTGPARIEPPSGRVAFLFSDLESSTDTWERNPELMTGAVRLHDEISRAAFTRHAGHVFSTGGDGFGVAFPRVEDAVLAAAELQRNLAAGEFPGGLEVRARIGIHVGTASEERDGDYFGVEVNRAARVMSVGAGGQVILSDSARNDLTEIPDGLSIVDLGRVRLKGITTPVPIFQLSVEGLRTEFPAVGLDRRPNTTPAFQTSFIGREADVAEVRRLVDEHAVVTVTASGGMGKSRLAAEIARSSTDAFPGGVYYVELADTGPGGVGWHLAAGILGGEPLASSTTGNDPLASVTRYVGDRRTLVVLDNCEHVRDEVGGIVTTLLTACPAVKVLATSRQHLGLAGESRFRLRELDVVGADGRGPAVDLFVTRAAAVDPTFSPDQAELATVVRICQRVEGIPLAIELAASRLGALSLGEIADRLDDAVALLRERHSKRPERHRSMLAAIEWSFESLDEDEQELFLRLSAFVGGCDLPAATAMAKAAELDPYDTLDLLQSLADKSLVVVRRTELGSRYHLLEPIRQFADAVLGERGLRAETWKVHRNHYSTTITLGVPEIDGPPGVDAVARLEADHDNIRAAIERSGVDEPGRALGLVSKMAIYWEESGRLAEGADLSISLLDRTKDPMTRLRFLGLPTAYGSMVGRQHDAERFAAEIVAALPSLPPPVSGLMQFSLGFVDNAAGRYEACRDRWMAAAELLTDQHPLTARTALLSVAYFASTNGHFDEADEMLALALEVEGPQQGWFADQHLGFTRLNESLRGSMLDPGLAESFDRFVALGLRFRTMLMAGGTALAAFQHGDRPLADRAWRLGLDIAREMGHVWAVFLLAEHAAWSLADDGNLEDAFWIVDSIDALGEQQGWRHHAVVTAMRPQFIPAHPPTSRPLGTAFDIVTHVADGPAPVDRLQHHR